MATQLVDNRIGSTAPSADRFSRWLSGPIARAALGLPMAVFGLLHFQNAAAMGGMVPSWVPGGVFWVYVTGVALIAAGVAFISNRGIRWAGLGLAVLMATFVVTIHLPGLANEQMAQFAMMSILKDTAIAGGALLLTARHTSPSV